MTKRRPDWNSSDWKPSERIKVPSGILPPGSLRDHERWLLSVFHELVRLHGPETTWQMLANLVTQPNKTQLKDREQFDTLQRLHGMKPRPNIKQLVRDMLAEQRIKPRDPRYARLAQSLDRNIRRWKKQRGEIEAKFGATSPPLAPGQPASYVLHQPKKRTSR